ncbi:MAG: hypothetical protein AAFP03_08345 [Cyanobacteria bacterium J06598_3]
MASYVSGGARSQSVGWHCESFLVTQRDRFHGTLLGLWLAPIALSVVGDGGGITNDDRAGGDLSEATSTAQTMAVTLASGFSLIHAFSSNANAFHQPLSALVDAAVAGPSLDLSPGLRPSPLPVWLVSLPTLLRYHDSRSLRLRWLDSQQSSLQALAHANHVPWAIAIEQMTQLGDFLEMALSGLTPPLLDYVTESGRQSPSQGTAQTVACDDFAKVLISAFGGSVETLFALESVFPPALWRTTPCKGEQMLLIGLLAGVLKGASQLPVLWQMTGRAKAFYGVSPRGNAASRAATLPMTRRVVIMRMANQLFDQWAGIQPI